jgi:tetratricopeptide (TPR) repeat protein
MPRNISSNANHIAVTDHRVLRRPDRAPPRPAERRSDDLPLVHYHGQLLQPNDEALTRDYGLALVDLGVLAEGKSRTYLGNRAEPLLGQAVTRAPDDVAAVEGRGIALAISNRPEEALQCLGDAITRAPERELALSWAVHVAEASGRLDVAEQYGRQLVERYPSNSAYQQSLAIVYTRQANWPHALRAAQAAVRLNPFSGEARSLLIAVHLAMADFAQARAEFNVLGSIDRAQQDRMRAWFQERIAGH